MKKSANQRTVKAKYVIAVGILLLTSTLGAKGADARGAMIRSCVDWQQFLARHDMVWNSLPSRWDDAPFLGNGLLGSMLYRDGKKNRLRLQIFRSDVQDHRPYGCGHSGFSRARLQIGSFYLTPVGKLIGGHLRLDYYNAELRGSVTTDKGRIEIRHLVHSIDLVIFTEVTTSGEEDKCEWSWEPAEATTTRGGYPVKPKDTARFERAYGGAYPTILYKPNPEPRLEKVGDVNLCVQKLLYGGQHATAWTILRPDANRQIHIVSIGKSYPEATARDEASKSVRKVSSIKDLSSWRKIHYDWWHGYYPASFVSLPDTRMETVYWAQMYKLASATRADRPLMDTAGLWQTPSKWPFVTWNLNVQLCYWPTGPSNRLDIGMSLINTIHRYRENLIRNVRPVEWQSDSAFVGLNTGQDLDQPRDLDMRSLNSTVGNLTWAMHDCWLLYRYSMDDEMLREEIFPMLRRSVNFMTHMLEEGEDGRYHLPPTMSPEYGEAPDANYELANLRWGCRTLLRICERLRIDDPLVPKWKDVLERLVDYPTNEDGFMVGRAVPFDKGHRHFSHLLMIYPYHLVNIEQPGGEELIRRSLDHWLAVNLKAYKGHGWGAFAAYTHTGASLMCAALADGNEALEHLNGFVDYPLVRRNSLYAESGPCLESPLSSAQCVHEMLLQSWGDKIRVFPAAPDSWKDVVFHNLRAEGGFLVSAVRRNEKTQWVRVKSLAGEPCKIKPNFGNDIHVKGGRVFRVVNLGGGIYELDLRKNEEVVLYGGEQEAVPKIEPLPAKKENCNWYGLRD